MSKGDKCAFPIQRVGHYTAMGLTKREYMATQLLAGILANPEHDPNGTKRAVVMADRLLAELEYTGNDRNS